MTPSESAHVALELEKLRGTMEAGFARTDGSLALLVQRGDQTDKRLDDHDSRLDTLERSRWPLPSLAVLVALAGLIYQLVQN
ncbi:hypothetical protein SVEN_2880 [Streptomyces venezuelae ATCC 10712]|uniref:Uncharacterized protein n=2 Tax=root TaxID=1 RepID=F2R6B5_STRVP|nr:hypothetical protein [Saccharothrix sp. NRRL B-16314]YP_010754234.1 hypothetical protein QEH31_gp22 [Streptomyces phage Chymera]AMS01581.1 hypothetical protein SEA_CHYMERA_22 [Streptomyces phage Chymera]CCA56166.1 hypothetical protein SVEN_2880 [Streptomyces venezuelae ATCC 10712]